MLAVPAGAAQFALTSPLAADNGGDGIMFDLVVGPRDIVFQSIGVDLNLATLGYELWTRDGSYVSGRNSAASWTLRGTFNAVTTNGAGTLTYFDVADFSVAAGSTLGVYFTGVGRDSGTVNYNNYFSDVPVAQDANLTITEGTGKSYAFSTNNVDRGFVGSIVYSADAPLPEPAAWVMMVVGFGFAGGMLRGGGRARLQFA
jgi:hypothetical protein